MNQSTKVHHSQLAAPEADIVSARGSDIVSTVPEFVTIEIYDDVYGGP